MKAGKLFSHASCFMPHASNIMDIRALINRLFSTRVPAKAPASAPISLDDAILNSKRQLLEVFDGIVDPIMIISQDFKILRLNMAALLLIDGKKSFNDCIGLYCYNVLHEKNEICDKCPVAEVFANGRPILEPRLVEYIRNDVKMAFDVSIFPLKDSNGKTYAAAKYFKDVTHTMQLEADLYEVERSRFMGSMAVGLAHEIRNPLAVISSIAQFLKSEFPEDMEIFDGMEVILRNTDQANNVIGDFLNFAKPKDTAIELINIEHLLEMGYRLIKKQLETRKINVKRKVGRDIPKLRTNQQNFVQAYINFLLTAADTMPNGGDIHVETELIKPENAVRITIKDTGHGFSPEVVNRLFKPFLRAKGGIASLRLPIAEEIIKTHGGKVDFQSVEGKGSTAVIKLPVV